jgi:hypothetical protein
LVAQFRQVAHIAADWLAAPGSLIFDDAPDLMAIAEATDASQPGRPK